MKAPTDYTLRPFEQTILENCAELSRDLKSSVYDANLLYEFASTLSDGYVSDNLLKAVCTEATQYENPAHVHFIARALSKNPERSHDVSFALRKHPKIEARVMETFRGTREASESLRARPQMSQWGATAAAICLALASHMVHKTEPSAMNATANKPAAVRAAKASIPPDVPKFS